MSTSVVSASAALGRRLEQIVGPAHVEQDPARLSAYAIDGVLPSAAVSPADVQQTAEILKLAYGEQLVVVPAGGYTHQETGAIPERADIVLCTSRLTAVEHYDPGDLTIGIGAGTTIAKVKSMVGGHGQVLPVDVADADRCTVGGLLATASHGPLKHAFGGARDFCIGIRFVTADGKIAKAGARVVKNVAGYDIIKLLIGSYGTLAVMTSASFKLFPAPRQTRTYVCDFGRLGDVLAFRDRVVTSCLCPLSLEIVTPQAHPFITTERSDGWRILLRAAGSDTVLARYQRELGTAVTWEVDGDDEKKLWIAVAEFSAAVKQKSHNAMLLRVDLPMTACGDALRGAERAGLDNNFIVAGVGRIGVGALLLAFIPLAVDPPAAMQYANAISAFRASLNRDASALVLSCPVEAKRHVSVWGSTPTDLDAMRAIKRAFDEKGVLNRGRFLF